MADIKTRDTSKGTIKTINKAAVATERMKKAYVMTKDKAEHSTNASENSAEEYASDKIEVATDRVQSCKKGRNTTGGKRKKRAGLSRKTPHGNNRISV